MSWHSSARSTARPQLRVLYAEHDQEDIELVLHQLRREGLCRHVDAVATRAALDARLAANDYDIVLSDFRLPNWSGLDVLRALEASGKSIPLILVTGTLTDIEAVECLKAGAADYVTKDHLARLPVAIRRALAEQRVRSDRLRALQAAEQSATEARLLFENIPVPVWVFDQATLRILVANDAAIQHYGYTREEFLRLTLRDLRPPDAVPELLTYLESKPQLTTKGADAGVWRHRKKDGTLIDVAITSCVFPFGATPAELVIAQDVTEQRQAALALQRSEERFRSLFEHARWGMYRSTPEGRFLDVNPALVQMLGYASAAELLAGNIATDIYADPSQRARLIERNAGRDDITGVIVRWKRKNGTVIDVRLNGRKFRDAQGRIHTFEMIVENVTDELRLAAEVAGRARIAELSAEVGSAMAQEPTLDGALKRCTEAVVRYLDAAIARVWLLDAAGTTLELRASAGLYTALDDQYARVPVGDRKIGLVAAERHPHMTNAVLGDPRVPDQEWVRREGIVSFAGYPLMVGDTLIGAVAMFARHELPDSILDGLKPVADLMAAGTHRKQAQDALAASEERFRQMAEHVNEAFFILDLPSRTPIYVSPTWSVIWGRPIEEAYRPGTWFEAVHPEDREMMARNQQRVAEGEPTVSVFRVVRPDRTTRWVRGRGFPVRNAQGQVYRIVGVAEDITEVRRVEEQMQQAQKMEAIGSLAGGIAHDFNNLLTVIMGEVDLLRADDLSPEMQESLREIRSAGERAAVLTRQLLTFSRRQLVEARVLNLNEIVTNLAKMLNRLVGENIAMKVTLAPDLGPVRADPGQIEQVIVNIVVNARDAMPQGGKLSLETRMFELEPGDDVGVPAGRYAGLMIGDTGTGMTPEVKRRIFEPFFTTKEPGKGTGLGLATCFGIVSQAGGRITVYSEVGLGTVFKIYLPVITDEATERAPTRAPVLPGGSETVLLVEDEVGVRNVASRCLTTQGYNVLLACDAEEALALSRSYDGVIHLLLTDVVLPRLSGRELAERIQSTRPAIKVLFASGYTDDVILQHRLLAHDVELVQKPFTREALARKVREALDC